MTREEAIKLIQDDIRLHHDYLSGKYRKALNMAIESLSAEIEQVTGKLKKPCDSLLTEDLEERKEQKSKLDLISRAEAIEAVVCHIWHTPPETRKLFNCENYVRDVVEEAINRIPSADVVHKPDYSYEADMVRRLKEATSADRPKGEWIIRDDMPKLDNTYSIECSKCGQLMFGHYNADNPNFCPHCGADMQLDK